MHHYYIHKLWLIDDKNVLKRIHPHLNQMIIAPRFMAMGSFLTLKCIEFICISLLPVRYVLFRRID